MSNNQLSNAHRARRRRRAISPSHRRAHRMRLSAPASVGERFDSTQSKLEALPATAEEILQDKLEKYGWEGSLGVLFAGTRDPQSPLAALREHETTIVKEIYSYITNRWAGHVKNTIPAAFVGRVRDQIYQFSDRRGRGFSMRLVVDDSRIASGGFDDGFVSFARCGRVEFPEPAERNVNMMPFILGDKDSLPSHLQCYFPLIEQCPTMKSGKGKVAYLTVHESHVNAGKAQRREGLHIESPGTFSGNTNTSSFAPAEETLGWGRGLFSLRGSDTYEGGIFMASSMGNTTEVWDALIDNRMTGIVDRHGGCEHLRALIGEGTKLDAGELIWMTDCTPHEALSQKENGYRQFFRVVTPGITHWYADHSTENPKVSLPPCVTVVRGNKFD
mmetsp:Transcript_39779/g.83636  ORF Transcript_39779/g.83636 Transcript_39779/m.83636 type:complete len:388 (-) Transcript_39779:465-1628(-)